MGKVEFMNDPLFITDPPFDSPQNMTIIWFDYTTTPLCGWIERQYRIYTEKAIQPPSRLLTIENPKSAWFEAIHAGKMGELLKSSGKFGVYMRFSKLAKNILNVIIVLYVVVIGWYYASGPFRINIHVDDAQKPLLILICAILLRLSPKIARKLWSKTVLFTALMTAISVVLTLGGGEILVRAMYPHGSATVAGGPGHQNFRYDYNNKNKRFPTVDGPKKPGITRILVQGDSVTCGLGVRDWSAIYPNRLLAMLNANGEKYDMETIAIPNRELDWHANMLRENLDRVEPDIIIYQFYFNDIQLEYCHHHDCGRPGADMGPWRQWRWHKSLLDNSYLYFFMDYNLWSLAWALKQPNPYFEWLNKDFEEGTEKGERLREAFHDWAVQATTHAKRVMIMMYPSLPYKDDYPLKPVSQRMKKYSLPNVFAIPVYTQRKNSGDNIYDKTSTFGKSRKAAYGDGKPGQIMFGPYIQLAKGQYTATFRLKLEDFAGDGAVADISVTKDKGKAPLASKTMFKEDFGKQGEWREFTLQFVINEKIASEIEFVITYRGAGALYADTISFPVSYPTPIEIVDLTQTLRGFDTYSSIFDFHPNAKTHAIMADELYKELTKKKPPVM
jgi:hypothetical protein